MSVLLLEPQTSQPPVPSFEAPVAPTGDMRLTGSMLVRFVLAVSGDFWLGGPGVLRPVRVHIEVPHDGQVVAVQHDTGIHGVGASAATAVEDLKAALDDHLVLLAQEEVLSDELEHQLNWLRRHISPPAA